MVWRVTAWGAGVRPWFCGHGFVHNGFFAIRKLQPTRSRCPATTGIRFDAWGVVSGVLEQAVPRACNSGTNNCWVSNDLASNGMRCGCGFGGGVCGHGFAGASFFWGGARVLGDAGKRMVWVPDERRSGLHFMRWASESCRGRQAGDAGFCAVARGSRVEDRGRGSLNDDQRPECVDRGWLGGRRAMVAGV